MYLVTTYIRGCTFTAVTHFTYGSFVSCPFCYQAIFVSFPLQVSSVNGGKDQVLPMKDTTAPASIPLCSNNNTDDDPCRPSMTTNHTPRSDTVTQSPQSQSPAAAAAASGSHVIPNGYVTLQQVNAAAPPAAEPSQTAATDQSPPSLTHKQQTVPPSSGGYVTIQEAQSIAPPAAVVGQSAQGYIAVSQLKG